MPSDEKAAPVQRERRMYAYYYGFHETGVDAVDKVLSAVAWAGKAFHHTESWTDETGPFEDHRGESPVEMIQHAACDAAVAFKQAIAEAEARGRAAERADVVAWLRIGSPTYADQIERGEHVGAAGGREGG